MSTDTQTTTNEHIAIAEPNDAGIAEPQKPSSSRSWRFWLVFPGLCFAMLLAALDTAIVATALPTSKHSNPLHVLTPRCSWLPTKKFPFDFLPLSNTSAPHVFDKRYANLS
jgi:hypothetical protein